MPTRWICCQLGAREHYAIPRALFATGQLRHLITDIWTYPGSMFAKISGSRGRERYHSDLYKAPITAWNWQLAVFEFQNRHSGKNSGKVWELAMERNAWFQVHALQVLESLSQASKEPTTLFSYSYTALRLFEFAKKAGWQTVLGQIDPGPEEERLVKELNAGAPDFSGGWSPAPQEYWKQWHRECELADTIVVNSEWSKEALVAEGIPEEKIRIIPLVYQPPAAAEHFQRVYPDRFTQQRPLQALFLGQINLRKGVGPILEAVELLEGLPIRFRMVGPVQIALPERLRNHPQIEWVGAVPRGSVAAAYRDADIFLFPTMSDGFGLTQLEAQSWQLPIIASNRCGAVVKHQESGWVLQEVTDAGLADILRKCVNEPQTLRRMASASSAKLAGLDSLREALVSCVS